MLIKPCYRVLRAVNYLCLHNESTSIVDIMVYFHQRTNSLDLENTIRQLVIDGYLEQIESDICLQVKPTYKGRHYSQYRWIAAKETILKSFLIPVAVAFVTTLLTLAVNGLFILVP